MLVFTRFMSFLMSYLVAASTLPCLLLRVVILRESSIYLSNTTLTSSDGSLIKMVTNLSANLVQYSHSIEYATFWFVDYSMLSMLSSCSPSIIASILCMITNLDVSISKLPSLQGLFECRFRGYLASFQELFDCRFMGLFNCHFRGYLTVV